MSIQKTILGALGSIGQVAAATRAIKNQERNLGIQETKLKIAQQSADVRTQREQRMQQESSARTAYYKGSAAKTKAQAQAINNRNKLDQMAITALQRSLDQQQMRLTQKQIMNQIMKVRNTIDGKQ